MPRTGTVRKCAFASRLGYTHSQEAFVSALKRHGGKHHDLFACWMQELVLRRINLAGVQRLLEIAKVVQRLRPLMRDDALTARESRRRLTQELDQLSRMLGFD